MLRVSDAIRQLKVVEERLGDVPILVDDASGRYRPSMFKVYGDMALVELPAIASSFYVLSDAGEYAVVIKQGVFEK